MKKQVILLFLLCALLTPTSGQEVPIYTKLQKKSGKYYDKVLHKDTSKLLSISGIRKALNKRELKQVEKFGKKNPDDISTHMRLIDQYLESGDYKLAYEQLTYFKQGDPAFRKMYKSQLLFYEGMVYTFTGKDGLPKYEVALKKFKAAYRKEVETESDNKIFMSDILNNQAFCILYNQSAVKPLGESEKQRIKVDDKDLEVCEKLLDEALKLNRDNAVAKENLEHVHKLRSRMKVAVPNLNPLGEANSDSSVIVTPLDTVGFGKINRGFLNKDDEDCRVYKFGFLPHNIGMLIERFKTLDELVIVLDQSGSMTELIENPKSQQITSRFDLAQNVALFLLDTLPSTTKIGLVTVGGDCDAAPSIRVSAAKSNREQLIEQVSTLQPGGWTPLNKTLPTVPSLFTDGGSNRSVFFLSDGVNSCRSTLEETCDVTEDFIQKNISFNTLSLLNIEEAMIEYSIYHCLRTQSSDVVLSIDQEAYAIKDQTIKFSSSRSRRMLMDEIFDPRGEIQVERKQRQKKLLQQEKQEHSMVY